VLVFALSLPLWLLGEKVPIEILPGLPLGAIMVVCPLAAAWILVARERGRSGVVAHLARSFDARRIPGKHWYVPIVLLQPAVGLLSYVLMRMLGLPLPIPQLSLSAAVVLFVVFFVAALCEESGWSGYLIDPLQERCGALGGSIALGIVWALWHWVPLLQIGRAPDWIAWWTLGTLSTRVLHTWLYNNTSKSVFGAILFHAMTNVSWQLFPNGGSHYDPRITGLVVTALAALVVLARGPRTLTGGGNDSSADRARQGLS
jgi:membrane protease YdiL (CAAX protease family)